MPGSLLTCLFIWIQQTNQHKSPVSTPESTHQLYLEPCCIHQFRKTRRYWTRNNISRSCRWPPAGQATTTQAATRQPNRYKPQSTTPESGHQLDLEHCCIHQFQKTRGYWTRSHGSRCVSRTGRPGNHHQN